MITEICGSTGFDAQNSSRRWDRLSYENDESWQVTTLIGILALFNPDVKRYTWSAISPIILGGYSQVSITGVIFINPLHHVYREETRMMPWPVKWYRLVPDWSIEHSR